MSLTVKLPVSDVGSLKIVFVFMYNVNCTIYYMEYYLEYFQNVTEILA